MAPSGQRSYRAHLNLFGQLLPFAILVLIIDRMTGFAALTHWAAIAFPFVRVVHDVAMITGRLRLPWRPVVIDPVLLCVVTMGVAVVAAA